MNNKFNKKLLLTLSILAYGLQVSGAQATRLAEEETSTTWSSIKSAAKYTTAATTTAVASVYAFGDKQEELFELKKQAIKGAFSLGTTLWDYGTVFCNSVSNLKTSFYQWAYDTYMPWHPTACYAASEFIRLGTEGCTAIRQTITEHPYVATGVAVTFVAAVGITHMIHKSTTHKAKQLLSEEKQKNTEMQKELLEAQEETQKAKTLAIKTAEKLKKLRAARTTAGPTVVSPKTTIKPQTNIKPEVTIDGHNTSAPKARALGGQGGNVTFNLVVPGTPETLSGFSSQVFSKASIPLILGNTAIKTEG